MCSYNVWHICIANVLPRNSVLPDQNDSPSTSAYQGQIHTKNRVFKVMVACKTALGIFMIWHFDGLVQENVTPVC